MKGVRIEINHGVQPVEPTREPAVFITSIGQSDLPVLYIHKAKETEVKRLKHGRDRNEHPCGVRLR